MEYIEQVVLASAESPTDTELAEVVETTDEEILVLSDETIEYLLEQFNSQFGSSRHVSKKSAKSVVKKACSKYSYLADEAEVFSAVLWDLHVFSSYATSGILDVDSDFSDYSEDLPSGHPDTEASLVAAATWVAGAPELENSGREALLEAFNESSDYVKTLHASTRVRAMVSSGSLSEVTLSQIKNLSDRYSKVN